MEISKQCTNIGPDLRCHFFAVPTAHAMPLCEAPFYPNDTNYVNDTEHDSNNRKMWFLVLDYGLFTKKCAWTNSLCCFWG